MCADAYLTATSPQRGLQEVAGLAAAALQPLVIEGVAALQPSTDALLMAGAVLATGLGAGVLRSSQQLGAAAGSMMAVAGGVAGLPRLQRAWQRRRAGEGLMARPPAATPAPVEEGPATHAASLRAATVPPAIPEGTGAWLRRHVYTFGGVAAVAAVAWRSGQAAPLPPFLINDGLPHISQLLSGLLLAAGGPRAARAAGDATVWHRAYDVAHAAGVDMPAAERRADQAVQAHRADRASHPGDHVLAAVYLANLVGAVAVLRLVHGGLSAPLAVALQVGLFLAGKDQRIWGLATLTSIAWACATVGFSPTVLAFYIGGGFVFGELSNRLGGDNGSEVLRNIYSLHHTMVRWTTKTMRGVGDLLGGEAAAVDRGLGYGIMMGDGITGLQNLGQSISQACRTGLWVNAASRPLRRRARVPRGPLPEPAG